MILILIILNWCFGNMTADSWRDCSSYTLVGEPCRQKPPRRLGATKRATAGRIANSRNSSKSGGQNRPLFRKLGAMWKLSAKSIVGQRNKLLFSKEVVPDLQE